MSASNWTFCPQCLADSRRERADELAKVEESYGKVPADEYLRMREEATVLRKQEETLREDWEIGTSDDGTFFAYYSCSCSCCAFNHKFEHKQKLKVNQ